MHLIVADTPRTYLDPCMASLALDGVRVCVETELYLHWHRK